MTGPTDSGMIRAVLDAIPSPLFIVDNDVRIHAFNEAASPLLGKKPAVKFLTRGGEALGCIHSTESPEGCGRSEACKNCVVRNSVRLSFDNRKVVRKASKMTLVGEAGNSDVHMLVTTAPFDHGNQSYVLLILEDISELVELRKLIPICASCKKIRDEKAYWNSLEAYFKRHLDIDFTHGICPDCLKRLYPDLAVKLKDSHEPSV
jgi:nitrogen fixation/metabolism regulation signal transduction histidine kinase